MSSAGGSTHRLSSTEIIAENNWIEVGTLVDEESHNNAKEN